MCAQVGIRVFVGCGRKVAPHEDCRSRRARDRHAGPEDRRFRRPGDDQGDGVDVRRVARDRGGDVPHVPGDAQYVVGEGEEARDAEEVVVVWFLGALTQQRLRLNTVSKPSAALGGELRESSYSLAHLARL